MSKRSYFKNYTIVFVITALYLCSWFFLTGRTFISKGDGICQHYPALLYYKQYLCSIIHNLIFEHHFVIPSWDFSIGEGSDILTTLHYYVIGDPFAFFSIFIPTRFMHLYYGAMILLRLYLAGIAFSCLCFQTNIQNTYGILAGSMTYIFCYWALYNIVGHPYFLNPMLYMPMLIIGIEKIIKNERPYFFIFSVFLSAISNFYFFYIIVLITVIYVLVRILFSYHNKLQLATLYIFKIAIFSILGVLIAAVIFLPLSYTFISDARMSANNEICLFYPLSYYTSLPAQFLTSVPGQSLFFMGYAAPVLPAVFLMFCKKRNNKILKLFFGISILIAFFPFFGHVLNGFSYAANRWSWAFALLCSYILSVMWETLIKLTKKEFIYLILATFGYFILCLLLEHSRTISIFVALIFVLFFLLILIPIAKKNWIPFNKKQQAALFIVMISIFSNIFFVYSSAGEDGASQSVDVQQVKNEYLNIDATAVSQKINEDGITSFCRFSGLELNSGFKTGLSSTAFYWSLSNPYVFQFRTELEMDEPKSHKYLGYNSRTFINALASVRYYVSDRENSFVPYCFPYIDTINTNNNQLQSALSSLKKELHTETLTESQVKALVNAYSKNYYIYQNDIPLPIAYTYNKILSEDTWDTLTATEKQEALLQAIFLKDYPSISDCKKSELKLTSQSVPYIMNVSSNDISIQKDSFVVTAPNASVTLEFDGLPNSETYFSIHNLSFTQTSEYDLYFGDAKDDPLNLYNKEIWKHKTHSKKEIIRKNCLFEDPLPRVALNLTSSAGKNNALSYYTEAYPWYNNRHDFILNMGYSSDQLTNLTISFSDIGTYYFDSLEIICQPMDNYIAQISELRKDVLENVTIETDSIKGKITLDTSKVLCFSIPYSIGWKATADGEEIPIYQANIMYMGIPLSEGEHYITLEYSTPFLKEGFYISCISLFIFVIYVIISERKGRMH